MPLGAAQIRVLFAEGRWAEHLVLRAPSATRRVSAPGLSFLTQVHGVDRAALRVDDAILRGGGLRSLAGVPCEWIWQGPVSSAEPGANAF